MPYERSQCRRAISHLWRRCGVRYHRLRVELKSKFSHHPRSYDAIRASLVAESASKRETTHGERFNWLSRVKRTQDATEPG